MNEYHRWGFNIPEEDVIIKHFSLPFYNIQYNCCMHVKVQKLKYMFLFGEFSDGD